MMKIKYTSIFLLLIFFSFDLSAVTEIVPGQIQKVNCELIPGNVSIPNSVLYVYVDDQNRVYIAVSGGKGGYNVQSRVCITNQQRISLIEQLNKAINWIDVAAAERTDIYKEVANYSTYLNDNLIVFFKSENNGMRSRVILNTQDFKTFIKFNVILEKSEVVQLINILEKTPIIYNEIINKSELFK